MIRNTTHRWHNVLERDKHGHPKLWKCACGVKRKKERQGSYTRVIYQDVDGKWLGNAPECIINHDELFTEKNLFHANTNHN